VDDDLLNLFEAIGSVYRRGLIDKDLAGESFGFYGQQMVGGSKAVCRGRT